MRRKATRLLCMVLLLAFSLTLLPSCGGESVTVEFEDAYLPRTNLAITDIKIGMSLEEFESLFDELEINVHYVKRFYEYFFRAKDGSSVVVSFEMPDPDDNTKWQVSDVSSFDISELATKKDFEEIYNNQEILTFPELVERLGLPIYFNDNFSTSVIPAIDFPVADGTICHVDLVYRHFESVAPFRSYKILNIEFS